MEFQELVIFIVAGISGIGGLILVILQKKGIVKPALTQTTTGFNFTSGGTITLFATAVGASILSNHDKILTILYIILFGGFYILIQILMRNKE